MIEHQFSNTVTRSTQFYAFRACEMSLPAQIPSPVALPSVEHGSIQVEPPRSQCLHQEEKENDGLKDAEATPERPAGAHRGRATPELERTEKGITRNDSIVQVR